MSSSVLKEARRLYRFGFAIIWLAPKSKRPVESKWTTGERKPWPYLEERYSEGLNVGVRLGTPSKLPHGYLAVIDVDVKSTEPHHEKEALQAALKLLGGIKCPVVRSGRGNGSRHYYCVTEKPFKTWNPAVSPDQVKVYMPSKKPSKRELTELTPEQITQGIRIANAWEVSLYSDGRQVVLPPSIHPDSGKPYYWGRAFDDVKSIPLVKFDAPAVAEKTPGKTASPEPEPDFEFTYTPVELDWLDISDKIKDAIKNGTGVTDRSGYLLPATTALLSAGLSRDEILSVLTEPDTYLGACAYEHAQTKTRARAAYWLWKYTLRRVMGERDAVAAFSGITVAPAKILSDDEADAQSEEFEADVPWTQKLQKTKEGGVKMTLKNLDLILSNLLGQKLFIRDLFANRDSYGIDTPWGGKKGAYLTDIDLVLAKRWLSDTTFSMEPGSATLLELTSLIAHRNRVHPVQEWLTSLEWDGVPRIDTWIKKYLKGEAPEPYMTEISRTFMLAMVKRVFEPGCQWDYVLVLEGNQGSYKSSTARALAGDRWFMDNLPDLRDKDAMLNLQGKWLVELGELAGVKRADYSLVKDYLIRRTDSVRSPYGRLREDIPRQSVFIGTVNEGQYLKDPTGNRRFWPVKVGICDVAGLKSVRDQLFAEAFAIYKKSNPDLKLGDEADMQARESQDDRRIDDDESEMREALHHFIEGQKELPETDRFDFSGFRSRELFSGPLAPWVRWADKSYAMQIGAQVLANLGFERRKVMGQRIWRSKESVAFLNQKRWGGAGRGQTSRNFTDEVADFY